MTYKEVEQLEVRLGEAIVPGGDNFDNKMSLICLIKPSKLINC
jgi:hypothetical protein